MVFLVEIGIILFACLWAILTFVSERAWRAVAVMSLATAALLLAGLFIWFAGGSLLSTVTILLPILAAAILLILFMPFGNPAPQYSPASERFDERDIMFARARYKPGDDYYQRYYSGKPEQQRRDDFTRSLPDLGEPGSKTWDPLNPAIAGSIFSWIERVRDSVDGPVNPEKTPLEPAVATRRLTGLARYLGAADAGTTAAGAEHYYSHVGRGSGTWGEEIDAAEHPWALVFTVEMNPDYIGSAPLQPALADSGRQYLEGAKIACALAEYIRMLGYPARAHIDGNYRLIMPTIAVEAGLGEIGRHSLLITPAQGTRVRIGAVTTTLPLKQANRTTFGVEDFCNICKKCSRNCPSNSIPRGQKTAHRGTEYWKIDEESCYRTWRSFGTDCGVCVNVCPYSRPGGLLHSFVRGACRANPVSRRLFHAMDDLFYGRRPRSRHLPAWMRED